jgi:hypothetical protein
MSLSEFTGMANNPDPQQDYQIKARQADLEST